ncbi:MAG TPA: hypothetical protein DDY29_05705 [Rhodobacteraceae bacterium]|jgi:hypothetical protein|nr:SH3 domain-containing protein [Paracoccaceae bacterium]HBG98228.1 hypothetical protein [Paracoccaceae bacterium]
MARSTDPRWLDATGATVVPTSLDRQEINVIRFHTLAAALALGLPAAALAQPAAFTAECPLGNIVVSDGAGFITVNGNPAGVEGFNADYYEARVYDGPAAGIVFSIARGGDAYQNAAGWLVSYTGPDRANGICTVRASGEGPGADDGGGAMAGSGMGSGSAPDFWRVNVSSTLNMHAEPSTASPTFARLQRGMVVRNLGCEQHEGRTWCMVPMAPNDGASIGWVAAEYLVPASGPATVVDHAATSAPHTQAVRVRFAPGTSGAEESGTLAPGHTVRYILGARNGQMLEVHFTAADRSVDYRIIMPNGHVLLDEVKATLPYQGQLYMSGDHVVEVINRGSGSAVFDVYFGIY